MNERDLWEYPLQRLGLNRKTPTYTWVLKKSRWNILVGGHRGRWKVPYTARDELQHEIDDRVVFRGHNEVQCQACLRDCILGRR